MAEPNTCGTCVQFKPHTSGDLASAKEFGVTDTWKDGMCTLEPKWVPVPVIHYCSHYKHDLYKDD